MVKILLTPIQQKDIQFFQFVADPRVICKHTKFAEPKGTQEYQRPWKPKKVKDIAKLVEGKTKLNPDSDLTSVKYAKGIIPNCPIIQLANKKYIKEIDGEHYLVFESEEQYVFETPIDGQHRLLSFREDYCKLQNSDVYEMGFILFTTLTFDDKCELFIICNDKQEKVPQDVTLAQKKAMGILSSDSDFYYSLLNALDSESQSPYYNRIKFNGETVKSGLSPNTMLRCIKTSTFLSNFPENNRKAKFLTYIFAWGEVFETEMHDTKHPLSKATGFNFIMQLGHYIANICTREKWKLDDKHLRDILEHVKSITESEDYFNPTKSHFTSETSSTNSGNEIGLKLDEDFANEGEFEL